MEKEPGTYNSTAAGDKGQSKQARQRRAGSVQDWGGAGRQTGMRKQKFRDRQNLGAAVRGSGALATGWLSERATKTQIQIRATE